MEIVKKLIRVNGGKWGEGTVCFDDDGAVLWAVPAFEWVSSPPGNPPAASAAAIIPAPPPFIVGPGANIVTPRRARYPGTYDEYLRTPQFKAIAARARKEWGNQCLLGVDHPGPVEMHHRAYDDVPFGEDWRTLIPLCEDCHARYHGRLATPPLGLFDLEDMRRAA